MKSSNDRQGTVQIACLIYTDGCFSNKTNTQCLLNGLPSPPPLFSRLKMTQIVYNLGERGFQGLLAHAITTLA